MSYDTEDLTQGSIYKKMLSFAIPFLLANFVQALYGSMDMAIVGWFNDASAISAVSIGSQIMMLINSLVVGVTMGGTILVAQYLGAKKQKDVKETISTMLSLFIIIGIILTFILFVGTNLILKLLQTPEEAFTYTKQYTQICILGMVFTFVYNGISSILRGFGDSKRPLLFITIACVCNIILDLVFVGIFKFGPFGAAVATIISQALSMLLSIIYLKRKDFIFDFKLKSFKLYKEKIFKIFKLGIPISLHETMVVLSFLIIAANVNTLGVDAAAAVGIAGKFDGFAMLPASALSGVIATMVAQNMGANNQDRAKKTLFIGIGFSFICALFFFAWIQIWPESVMKLFKASDGVIKAGSEYMKAFSWDFLMVSFVFCINGFFNGCGKTVFAMFNGLLSTFFVRIPLVFILGKYASSSLFGIGLAAPLASAASIIVGFLYMKTGRWKQSNCIKKEILH